MISQTDEIKSPMPSFMDKIFQGYNGIMEEDENSIEDSSDLEYSEGEDLAKSMEEEKRG